MLVGVLVLGAFLATGCARTRPWQRENLARPEMVPDGDSGREALRHHVLSTREGAVGGFGGGGGGCGCN
ncbi:MAG: DUF4266 domain-containing protein [Kofleriaceae bacterium]|nr:MAG: DUF4266 domain-containing protein [Kofleriaceae bacterium]MBZ0236243.1 DUF4266 domain-containing protein [Kofleriaceae bacterium]